MNLKGTKVLITGAAKGIGFCLAEGLMKKGARLILVDKDFSALAESVYNYNLSKAPCPGKVIHYSEVDVSSYADVSELFHKLNTVDDIPEIIINNAGIGHNGNIKDTVPVDWEKLLSVNLMGPINMVSIFLAGMKWYHKTPHIVNVSSGQAFFKLPTWGAYAATKAALSTFSELLAIEESDKIKVTTVYPFMVDTGFYDDTKLQDGTLATKLSMQLIPYYSNKPETVAKKIIRAIEKGKKVEMIHPLNWVAYYLDTIPQVGRIFRRIVAKLLCKKS